MAIFSGNALKLIAAALMLIDHVGLIFFPDNMVFRMIGRPALPIFAFFIAEGCRYTRSRARYFGMIFLLAVICQIVYFVVDGSMYLSVLFTFSASILCIFALQYAQAKRTALSALVFAGAVAGVYLANRLVTIDYGFWGCMTPVFAALLRNTRFDRRWINTLMLGAGLVILALDLGGRQFWALLAIPLLLLYSGRRGKWRMKYFFYIFYPLHLAALQLIAWMG